MKPHSSVAVGLLVLGWRSVAFADESNVKAEPLPSSTGGAPVVASAGAPATPLPPTSASFAPAGEPTTLPRWVRPNKPLLFTGTAVGLAAYLATVTATLTSNNSGALADKRLLVPIIGPWVHLASATATAGSTQTDTHLALVSGVVQGIGAALMVASIFIPEKVRGASIQAGSTAIHFAPASFGAASAGLGAGGTF